MPFALFAKTDCACIEIQLAQRLSQVSKAYAVAHSQSRNVSIASAAMFDGEDRQCHLRDRRACEELLRELAEGWRLECAVDGEADIVVLAWVRTGLVAGSLEESEDWVEDDGVCGGVFRVRVSDACAYIGCVHSVWIDVVANFGDDFVPGFGDAADASVVVDWYV